MALNILSIWVLKYWIGAYCVEFKRLPRLISEDNDSATNISVIIPVRNEGLRIKGCLDSILKQKGAAPR